MSDSESSVMDEYEDIQGLEWFRKIGVVFSTDGYPVFTIQSSRIIQKLQKFTEKCTQDQIDASSKNIGGQ